MKTETWSMNMRSTTLSIVALVVGLGGVMDAGPAWSQTATSVGAETRLYACYARGTGTAYRIKEAGLPQSCRHPDVEFSWAPAGLEGSQGPPGAQGATGDPGADGPDGEPGARGTACWDLNGNGVADPAEDVNGDGVASVLDCMGPRGADGAAGNTGATGASGPAGVANYQCPANSPFAMREPWDGWGFALSLTRQAARGTFRTAAWADGSGADAARFAPWAPAQAGSLLASPLIGEIRLFAGNFAPVGWAFAHGQLLPISDYETLFILIGTTYGGNGETTFGLPDTRGTEPACANYAISLFGVFAG
jgi:hypothetical protein